MRRLHRLRRIGAYGLARDESGRVLLVRVHDRWLLPGGGVEHGEHPAETTRREVAEETGLQVTVADPTGVFTDLELLAEVDTVRHHDRLVYAVTVVGGELRDEIGGSSDRAAWFTADELADLPLFPFVRRLLALPLVVDADENPATLLAASKEGRTARSATTRQRFAAYGLVTDPADRVLLTRIAEGYPGAGSWHLPGGGTDFGEDAIEGFLRELTEETNQRGEVTDLLAVSHRHQRDAVGPERRAIDWHGVRAVFRATVPAPTSPRVLDRGGSTSAAAWFTREQALDLQLTEVARESITQRES